MFVWRLYRKSFGPGLDGLGGLYTGGRWHTKGHYCTYLGASASIVILERLVHLDPIDLEADLVVARFEIDTPIDDHALTLVELREDAPFEDIAKTQRIGDAFLDLNKMCLLRVPSVIVPEEHNFLFNPNHPDARKTKLIAERHFTFDKRLL